MSAHPTVPPTGEGFRVRAKGSNYSELEYILLIQRAFNAPPALIQNMGINHRSAHVFMHQQLLHRANIIPEANKCVAKE